MTSLPDGWIECPVGRLGKALGGLAFRPQDAKEEPAPDLIACFRTSNIQQRLDQRDVLFIPRILIRNEEQLLQEGDILISTANSDALVGKCVIVEGLQYPATLGGFISAFRVDPKYLNPRFFFFWLSSPLTQARMRSLARKTTNIANLAMSDVAKAKIPLPPLSEQQRIVDILQEAEEIRRLRSQAEAKTAALGAGIFASVFGAPASWSGNTKLGDLVRIVGGGTPSKSVDHFFTGSIPWATSKDVKKLYLDDTQDHVSEEAIQSSATNLVPKGTLLVVVKSKILAHSLPMAITEVAMCFGQDLKGLIPHEGIAPEFLLYALNAQADRVLSRARGANTEGLTLEALKSLPLPTPDSKLISMFVKSCAELKEIGSALNHSERLFSASSASLFAHAFTGQLTASERLKRAYEGGFDVLPREAEAWVKGQKRWDPSSYRIVGPSSDGEPLGVQPLTREQASLWSEINTLVWGTDVRAPYFTAEFLADRISSPLHRNPQSIEMHLKVFAVRGLIIPVSLPRVNVPGKPYAATYRLPVTNKFSVPYEGDDVKAKRMKPQRTRAAGKR